MKQVFLIVTLILCGTALMAQDQVFDPNIKSAKLYRAGDQTSFPILPLSGNDALELHFDDLDNHVKNYYYTYQLCNADWTPAILHPYEYIKGFQNARITTYRNSSLSTTRYVHYQAMVPDRNCYPIRSGNYLLKIFLDNDTTKLAFTKRMVVTDNKASVSALIQQPFNYKLVNTGQKLTVAVQTDARLQVMSPSDMKIVILQNNNWQTSAFIDHPTIYRGNYYEYSDETQTAMPGVKEFRWIDLRSLRLKSDRMMEIDNHHDTVKVDMKPDPERNSQVYIYYRDLNGSYTIETMEDINPYWQGDYAMVHLSYVPPGNRAIEGSDLYLFGEFTNYATDTSGLMHFNKELGVYEKDMFLKQGYYNYMYVTKPVNGKGYPDFSQAEGNYYGTENSYLILVYYRSFNSRADEVVAFTRMNSIFQK
jgi:hypothetical protein